MIGSKKPARPTTTKSQDPYLYTECGLDYVYLLDGFKIDLTAHGPVVHVANASKLDRAIGIAVVQLQKRLADRELRFLRGLLDMTQEELGQILGKDAQTVARWEKGKTELPFTEDIAIRQIYLEETGHRQTFVETSRKVSALKGRVQSIKFKIGARHANKAAMWSMAADRHTEPAQIMSPKLPKNLRSRCARPRLSR